jgi:putative C-S lyase
MKDSVTIKGDSLMEKPVYPFDQVVHRREHGSAKWEGMKKAVGPLAEKTLAVSIADMDFPMAPEIVEALKDAAVTQIYGYTIPTDAYFEAVMDWMSRRHQWRVEKESICLAPGVVAAIYYLIYALTQPGDGILIQPPVYGPFPRTVLAAGRQLLTNPLLHQKGYYTIDFDDLERKAAQKSAKMLILSSPHNPVGRVWQKEELERILHICLKHDVFLLSDEIHFDIVFPPHRHTVAAVADTDIQRQCAVCTSPSKSFNIAGLQVSNIIIPNREIREKYTRASQRCGFHSLNTFAYPACLAAYRHAEPWLEAMLQYIQDNDRLVRGTLETQRPNLTVSPLEATYLQWIDFSSLNLAPPELQKRMREQAHLFFEEGPVFGKEGNGFERLNLAYPRTVMEEVLRRVLTVV